MGSGRFKAPALESLLRGSWDLVITVIEKVTIVIFN